MNDLRPSGPVWRPAIAGLILVGAVLKPVTGRLSDRVGRKPLFFVASAASVMLAYPMFQIMVAMHSIAGLILAQSIASLILSLYAGAIRAVLADQFPTNARCTALSIGYGSRWRSSAVSHR